MTHRSPRLSRPRAARRPALAFAGVLLVASVMAGFFTFRGFATEDSIRYALGIERVVDLGFPEIHRSFNGEMSPGYYLFMSSLVRFIGSDVDLSSIMNYTASISSIFLIGIFLFFVASLDQDFGVAVFSCLLLIFAPGIWFLSHYGNPGIVALTLWILSLFVFDRIIVTQHRALERTALWVVFVLIFVISMSIRLDIVLCCGTFFGLMYYRESLSLSSLLKVSGVLVVAFTMLFAFRYLVLGFVFDPTGGTFSHHLATRLSPEFVARNVIKNAVLWALSANVAIFLVAALGTVVVRKRWRLSVLLATWVAPWSVFLVFRNMDTARIMAPTIPALVLGAAVYLGNLRPSNRILGFVFFFVISQLVSVAGLALIQEVYPFKREVNGRVLGAVPLGFLPADHFARQKSIEIYEKRARQVVDSGRPEVLVIGGYGHMYYRWEIRRRSGEVSAGDVNIRGIFLERDMIEGRVFYYFDLTHNWLVDRPISQVLAEFRTSGAAVHVVPLWSEFPIRDETLFLSDETQTEILERERAVMDGRRKMIHR